MGGAIGDRQGRGLGMADALRHGDQSGGIYQAVLSGPAQNHFPHQPIFGSDRIERPDFDPVIELNGVQNRLARTVMQSNAPVLGDIDAPQNLSGIVDIEFLIQVFRLRHGVGLPSLRSPNELQTLRAIEQEELLDSETCRQVGEHYTFLRKLEKRLRMVTNRATDDLPEDEGELDELAYSMGLGRHEGNLLVEKCRQVREDCRKLFEKCVSV